MLLVFVDDTYFVAFVEMCVYAFGHIMRKTCYWGVLYFATEHSMGGIFIIFCHAHFLLVSLFFFYPFLVKIFWGVGMDWEYGIGRGERNGINWDGIYHTYRKEKGIYIKMNENIHKLKKQDSKMEYSCIIVV